MSNNIFLLKLVNAFKVKNVLKFFLRIFLGGRTLQVYHQERTVSKFLYQSGLPAMSQMSLCFWAKLTADDDNRREDWFVSIARPGLCKCPKLS